MASKVAEAFVQLSAKTDMLRDDMRKAQDIQKKEFAKQEAYEDKLRAEDAKKAKKDAEDKKKLYQSYYAKMASMASGAFKQIESGMNKLALSGAGLIASFTAMARSGDFLQSKMLGMSFDALHNEIYMALIPAINLLFPIFERLRVIIYQNRSVFVDFGTIAAKSLGFIVEVVGKVLRAWRDLDPNLKKTLITIASIAIPIAIIGSKLMFIIPLIAKIGPLFAGVLGPIGLVVAAIGVIGAALAYASTDSRWVKTMTDGFNRIWGVIKYVKQALEDALIRMWTAIKPHWDKFVGFAVGKFDQLTKWIDRNKEDFGRWANLIGEIVGNLVGMVIDRWTWLGNMISKVFSFIGDNSGITWQGIKDFITDTLDVIALVTSDFGTSMDIAWLAIQIGATKAWDFIKDGAYAMAAAVSAAFAGMAEDISIKWHNIKSVVKGDFDAIITDDYKRINEAMNKEFKRVMSLNKGSKDAIKAMEAEMSALIGKLGEGRKAGDDAVAANKAKKENKGAEGGAPPPVYTIKFETVGLKDLYKKMQDSITGGGMGALAARQAQAAEENVRVNRDMNENIKKLVNKPNDNAARAS